MSFREFAETVSHEWVKNSDIVREEIASSTKRKFMSRDVNSGHWVLKSRLKHRHVRFSTMLYTDRPCFYEPTELGDSTTQTSFFSLPLDKSRQLYRVYTELVCYIP